MFSAVARRREQGEQQVHGPVIDCAIGDRGFQPDEDGGDPVNALDPRVRDCDAGPQSG